ncbi:MAG: selenide, water dikinase SelD, partial [Pirellulaceae bacterium]|nr:selenide, water dikinase SelD [Pirellulaceae bacterium]
LDHLGLPLDERGFLATDHTLRSISAAPIFAVGDTGTIVHESLPKAGVYAVRQGPVLWENIKRILDGDPLETYRPQRSFLKLLNTGDGRAIGQWKGFAWSGRSMMWLKEWIDGGFMEKYRVDDQMMDDDQPMQCRGCGCKLGADALDGALFADPEGDDSGIELEDAAKIGDAAHHAGEAPGQYLASTDFFTSPFSDAYLAGRVAALHSASDIIASGAQPTSALGNVVLPEGDQATQQKSLSDFIAGARREFSAMGASIVGGHTIVGPRMEIGFTVIGRADGPMMCKENLQDSDALFVTKGLGIGVLLAAHMRAACSATDFGGLLHAMLLPQHGWVNVFRQLGVTAVTDVTGFGLAGHLIEMLRASDVAGTLDIDKIPLLAGADRYLSSGIESSLVADNRRFERWIKMDPSLRTRPQFNALFDPQTCGGLLFGIPSEQSDDLHAAVDAAGLQAPLRIGSVHSSRGVTTRDDRCLIIRG